MKSNAIQNEKINKILIRKNIFYVELGKARNRKLSGEILLSVPISKLNYANVF